METALITGATEGIGYELALLFASKETSLVIVARNQEKLEKIAKELQNQVNVSSYALDLSKMENVEKLYRELKEKNITVDYLINNAGFGITGEFLDMEWEKLRDMFNLNMLTVAFLTRKFATDMKKRNKGRILNVGSTASFQPGPYMAGYCASKAFVLSLSEAVNFELRNTNVSVSTLCPGVTDSRFHFTAMSRNTKMHRLMPHATSREVAEFGFQLMMKRKPLGIHGMINRIIVFLNRITPRNTVVSLSARVLKPED